MLFYRYFIFIFTVNLFCPSVSAPYPQAGNIGSALPENVATTARKTLTIHMSSICPFQCLPSENDGNMGLFFDVSRLIFNESGYDLIPVYVPFSRATVLAQRGDLDIIATVYKNEVPGLLYPDEHIAYANEVFFVRADDPWRYTGISSLTALQVNRNKIIISQGYDYGDYGLKQYITDNDDLFHTLSGEDVFARAIQQLLHKRARVAVLEQSVMAYTLGRLHQAGNIIPAGAVH